MILIPDAAAARGVSARRLQVLAAAGRIPGAVRTGRIWRVPADFQVTPPPKRPGRKSDKLGAQAPQAE